MPNIDSRELILSRIRKAKTMLLPQIPAQPEQNASVFHPITESEATCFKKELELVSGKCEICPTEAVMAKKIHHFITDSAIDKLFCRDNAIIEFLQKNKIPYTNDEAEFTTMQAAITSCEFLVARTGTVVVSSAGNSGRQLMVFPPIHLVIATKKRLVPYLSDAITALQHQYGDNFPSLVSFVSGPSRTADIEKTLVLGAHGPKQLQVFLHNE